MRNIGGVILAIFVVLALFVGIYLGSWWLREDSVNRNAQINQDGYGRQNALVEQILDDIEEAERASTPPNQRVALVGIVCDSAAKLTGSIQLPQYANTFIALECN